MLRLQEALEKTTPGSRTFFVQGQAVADAETFAKHKPRDRPQLTEPVGCDQPDHVIVLRPPAADRMAHFPIPVVPEAGASRVVIRTNSSKFFVLDAWFSDDPGRRMRIQPQQEHSSIIRDYPTKGFDVFYDPRNPTLPDSETLKASSTPILVLEFHSPPPLPKKRPLVPPAPAPAPPEPKRSIAKIMPAFDAHKYAEALASVKDQGIHTITSLMGPKERLELITVLELVADHWTGKAIKVDDYVDMAKRAIEKKPTSAVEVDWRHVTETRIAKPAHVIVSQQLDKLDEGLTYKSVARFLTFKCTDDKERPGEAPSSISKPRLIQAALPYHKVISGQAALGVVLARWILRRDCAEVATPPPTEQDEAIIKRLALPSIIDKKELFLFILAVHELCGVLNRVHDWSDLIRLFVHHCPCEPIKLALLSNHFVELVHWLGELHRDAYAKSATSANNKKRPRPKPEPTPVAPPVAVVEEKKKDTRPRKRPKKVPHKKKEEQDEAEPMQVTNEEPQIPEPVRVVAVAPMQVQEEAREPVLGIPFGSTNIQLYTSAWAQYTKEYRIYSLKVPFPPPCDTPKTRAFLSEIATAMGFREPSDFVRTSSGWYIAHRCEEADKVYTALLFPCLPSRPDEPMPAKLNQVRIYATSPETRQVFKEIANRYAFTVDVAIGQNK